MFGDFPHLADICSDILHFRSKANICPKSSFGRYREGGMSFRSLCIIKLMQGGLMGVNQEVMCTPFPTLQGHLVSDSPAGTRTQGCLIPKPVGQLSVFLPYLFALF